MRHGAGETRSITPRRKWGGCRVGVPAALSLLLVVGSACTTVVDSDVLDREALQGAATWTLLTAHPSLEHEAASARRLASYRVRSPGRDALGIDRALLARLEDEMAARGYRRVDGAADVYLHYLLALEPRVENVKVPLAARTVHSFSDQPTYTVEGTTIERRVREHLRFDVEVKTEQADVLWAGRLERILDRERDLPLEDIVRRVMRSLPDRDA